MQIGDPNMDKVCAKAIVPAIEASGLQAKRVDKHNEGGLLKSEIIKFIHNSDIIVADLTNERPNCYLEIGYAMGIDKFRNLILTVREDHFPESPNYVEGGSKVHFDLGGYDILRWKMDELEDFRIELEKRIGRRKAIVVPKEKESIPTWDKEWLKDHSERARKGLAKSSLPGAMEIRFSLQPPKLDCKLQELNKAACNSTIDTFGRPIGVYLSNREEFRPRPRADGVIAEVAMEDRSSYDYWTIKRNGDFYSLSSLFEDRQKPGQLFIDRRVARATEGLLYCASLYSDLGVDPTSKLQLSIRLSGLRNRILSAANPENQSFLNEKRCDEDELETTISTSLQQIEANLVDLVKELLSPVFILFDFFELSDSVYKDIVNKFVLGKV